MCGSKSVKNPEEIALSLSSCEGELVAATMEAAEGILMKEILKFLLSVELKIVEPELERRLDSSSARQWLQQAGVGRLTIWRHAVCGYKTQ